MSGIWRERKRMIPIILSFLGTYGVCYLLELTGSRYPAYNVMSVFLAVVIFILLKRIRREQPKRHFVCSAAVSFAFSLILIMGYQLDRYGMTDCGVKGKGMILLRALCLSIAMFPFGDMLLGLIEKIPSGMDREERPWKSGVVFGISFGAIFLLWIPVWMAYYPIVMSYDFHRQVNEAYKGWVWFNAYQPLIHTWLIWLFLQIGGALGSNEAGMGLFTLFQMLAVSAAMGYACAAIYRMVKRKWAVALTVLFYGLFPFCSVSMMVGTKDAIFSALFLTFTILLAERCLYRTGRKWSVEIPMVVTAVLMMMFRYNALYAMAAFGVLSLLFAKGKEKLRLFLLCAVMTVGGRAAQEGIQRGLGTELRGSSVEKYSVLIQQFARVGHFHGEDMEPEIYELVDRYVSADSWQDHMPALADASRGGVDFAGVWEPDMAQVIKDWIKVGLKYPNEYIDAFLCMTEGFWFPDDRTYCEMQGWGGGDRHGAIFTNNSSASDTYDGIQHISKFPWLEEKLEDIVSNNAFYNWPVVSVLFKPAVYTLSLLLVTMALIYRKQKKQAYICLFPLIYFGTMLLGPTVQFRYVLPIMITVPVLAALTCVPGAEDNGLERAAETVQ
ncbi:MAG: glycosyltransferase family 39 protein [Blautia sp.]|nr:glycosyltransferase family 39 protein [Blautia sp.]